jgi:hypothetical protein
MAFLGRAAFAAFILAGALRAADPTEYELKGLYLYNFTKYIEWPAGAEPTGSTPFVIAVADRDGAAADQIAARLHGLKSDGHPIEVVRVADGPSGLPPNCQIIFISRSAAADFAPIRQAVAGKPVLLVGETDGFAEQGGEINFFVEDGGVHFEINPERAKRAGLDVSGSLASIRWVRKVRDKGEF